MLHGIKNINYMAKLYDKFIPAGNFNVNRNTRTRCEICSNLTIKTPMASFWYLYC